MSAIQIPIITDPKAFIAEQYNLLSPNWDSLTGREQYDIMNTKYPAIKSGTTTVNGVLPLDTPDSTCKTIALTLSKAYIYMQSGNNQEVADCMGYKDVTALAESV